MDVSGCISSIIGKMHLVIEWFSWLPNNSGFISYNVLDTLTRFEDLTTKGSLVVGSKRLPPGRVKFSKLGVDNF